MSFYENVARAVSHWFGGDVTVEDAVKAAVTHACDMEPAALANALQQALPSLDDPSRAALAQHLENALEETGAPTVSASGPASGAAQGSIPALSALIDRARDNPSALHAAAADFIRAMPGAVSRLGPAFLDGVKARLDFQ